MSDTHDDLLKQIAREAEETAFLTGRAFFSDAVMAALRCVRRDAFVPEAYKGRAYENHALPIGQGQTISQPYMVALMTELLQLESDSRVLEIGTGSGYQTAVLCALAGEVYSIERIPYLADQALNRLHDQGIENVRIRCGDGALGWEEYSPFDAIIVTAAARRIPEPLLAQLKRGGHMVIPVGPVDGYQELVLVEKSVSGQLTKTNVIGVAFVPLVSASLLNNALK